MTGIQSSVGLISGIDYTSLVDQLIQIDAIPKTNLETRTKILEAEQAAITELLAKFLTSSYMIGNLNKINAFQRVDVTSGNESILSAAKSGTPIAGSYTFTPLQTAMAQQTIAGGVVSDTDALGKTGTITIGKGWDVTNDVELKDLNGGAGFTRGTIRITDGSGTRATVDLTKAVTMDDVVKAINSTYTIDVQAELDGDRLVLTDMSGGDYSKFLVQEVTGGTTAESLGIKNLTADSNGVATGSSLYRLGEDMPLSMLNDGNGVVFDDVWADIVVRCKDGSTVNIDFYKRATTAEIAAGAPEIAKETTIGDVIRTINDSKDANGNGGKVTARISDDGKGLIIEDTTTGLSGSAVTTFTQLSTNPVFKTLGLINGEYSGEPITSANGTLTTRHLIGSLDSVLMSTLNGGNGMGNAKPGVISVQDKAGNTADLQFTQADVNAMHTLKDTVNIVNTKLTDAGIGLKVAINDAGTGLVISDTTGQSGSIKFFDKTEVTPAQPAVPGVSAVSAPTSTGVPGTAVLTFNDTSALNGVTFVFTDDPSVFSIPGAVSQYDDATKTLTMYSTSDLSAYDDGSGNVDEPALDADVKSAIDTAISAHWAEIAPGSALAAPQVELTSGLGLNVTADAAVGGSTAIEAGLPGAVLGAEPVPEIPEITNKSGIAEALGFKNEGAAYTGTSVKGTSLNRQVISYATNLADLNGGKGVNLAGGKFVITDSLGMKTTITIDSNKVKTVGDVIKSINSQNTKVVARINDTGDGIVLSEFGGGTGSFSVLDADSASTFAAELGIAGSVPNANKDDAGRMYLSARQSYTVEVEATDSLDTIRQKINDLNAGFSATIVNDGSSTPYRLAISGKNTGAAGSFNIDLSAIGLKTENMTEARDALLVYGDASSNSGVTLHSSTNAFKNVVNGINITVNGTSAQPITVTAASSNIDVKVSLSTFVENYNVFREKLNEYMYYDTGLNQGNILYNSDVARAFDRDISNILLQRVYGIPGINSLADLGISLRSSVSDDGLNKETSKLVFDEDKFIAAWDRNKDAVQKFFFDEKTIIGSDGKETKVNQGWAQKFMNTVESLTNIDHGKAQMRWDTLERKITSNNERVEFMQARLDVKRQMMLNKFYAMETAMAKMSDDMSTVSNIASNWSSNMSS
ncbi:hypothetical protein FACS189454_08880 [Planctomycetales bacterium]|nr:hypothetical protein FACS189454_08880 [Planctomycetales bacterium]